MNANQFINSRAGGYVALGCLGVAVVWYISKKIPSLQGVVNAVSPLNNDNVFTKAADSIGKGITGENSWSLGGSIFDYFHTDYDPNTGSSGGFDWESLNTIINPAAWAGAKVGDKLANYDYPELTWEDGINYAGYLNPAGAAGKTFGNWLADIFGIDNGSKTESAKKVDGDYKDYLINNTDSIGDGSW